MLKQPFLLLRARFAAQAADPHVAGAVLVVPHVMHVPAAIDGYDRSVATERHVPQNLEVGSDFGAYLVAARLHHPLLEPPIAASVRIAAGRSRIRIGSGQTAKVPVIVDPEQDAPSLQVGERDQFLGQCVVVNVVAMFGEAVGPAPRCPVGTEFTSSARRRTSVYLLSHEAEKEKRTKAFRAGTDLVPPNRKFIRKVASELVGKLLHEVVVYRRVNLPRSVPTGRSG